MRSGTFVARPHCINIGNQRFAQLQVRGARESFGYPVAALLTLLPCTGGGTTKGLRDVDNQNEDVIQDSCSYLIEADQIAQAVIVLKQFIGEPPAPPWANVLLGKCLCALGHHDEGLEAFWQALDENPDLIDARFNAGLAAQHLGEFEQALNHFKEVILLNSKDARAYNHLGECCLEMTMHDDAQLFFAQARRLAPDFQAPIDNLRKLWNSETVEEEEEQETVTVGSGDFRPEFEW